MPVRAGASRLSSARSTGTRVRRRLLVAQYRMIARYGYAVSVVTGARRRGSYRRLGSCAAALRKVSTIHYVALLRGVGACHRRLLTTDLDTALVFIVAFFAAIVLLVFILVEQVKTGIPRPTCGTCARCFVGGDYQPRPVAVIFSSSTLTAPRSK